MKRNLLIERLINREIKRLVSEAAYATDLGKTVGAEGLKYLNDKNSLLNKALKYIPGASGKAKDICVKLQNGQIDLTILDKVSSGIIKVVANSYALILTPMLSNKNVKGFVNADPGVVKNAIRTKFGNVPTPIVDCILQIQTMLKRGGYRRDAAEYGRDISQAAKSGISLHHMR